MKEIDLIQLVMITMDLAKEVEEQNREIVSLKKRMQRLETFTTINSVMGQAE